MEATKQRKVFSKAELKSRLKNGRLVTDKDYRYTLLCGLGLAIAVVAFTMLYLTRVYSLSKGWAYVYYALTQAGKVPYRDFYYYLPPGNLFINWIIYTISGTSAVLPVYIRLAERLLLCELLYGLLVKRVRPLVSALTVFGAMMLAMARNTELGGDYNQTTYLTLTLLLAFFLKYTERIDQPIRKKAVLLMAVGACGGFMFLVKQTIVVAAFIVFFLLLSFLFLVGKEKNYFSACLFVLIGAVFIMAPFFVYLAANNALTPFIHQVFLDTSAKGDAKTLLAGHLLTFLADNAEKMAAVLLLLFSYVLGKSKTPTIGKKTLNRRTLRMVCLAASIALFSHLLFDTLWKGGSVIVTSCMIIPLAVLAAALLLFDERKKIYGLVVFAVMMLMLAVLIWNVGDMTVTVYKKSGLFGSISSFIGYGFFAVLFWLIYHIVVGLRHKNLALDKIVFACAALAAAYATLMNNGKDDVSCGSAYFLLSALVVIVFKNVDYNSLRARTYTKVLATTVLCILCVSASQKLVCPYSWWGYTAEDYWSKTETSSLPELKGYKLSKNDVKLYDEITKLIRDNTDEDSVIFGFPYVKCYNALLGNVNMDNFVPVLFYDTCADQYARQDAKILAENEPDIVVWLDVKNCMETHEKMFRGGNELGQRQIQKWFQNAKETDYTLIGQVDNLFVYKLTKDGQTVGRTYIQRPTRPNSTSKYPGKTSALIDLEGSGTKEEPYLIGNLEDLEYFRDVVNAGKVSLKGRYFRQTSDIDLAKISDWTPIGIYGKEKYFNGIYDGDGYEIRNLHIDAPKKNVGLFGVLNGTVMNLNLVDCNITGKCVGGITSHGKAKIYNCYVSGSLDGTGRIGGIADNAAADIINCVTEITMTGEGLRGGISGYYTNDIYNCFSRQGNDVCIDDGLAIPKNVAVKLNDYDPDEDRLNVDATLWNNWVQSKDGTLRVGHEKREQ